jgi:integrase
MAELTPEAEERVFGKKASSNNGKSPSVEDAGTSPLCPQCGSRKLWRDGLRYSIFGDSIQRWLCRECGLRFSDPDDIQKSWSRFEKITRTQEQSLKSDADIVSNSQICVTETKNLAAEQQALEVLRRKTTDDVKGKIVEYAWYLKKAGRSEITIEGRVKLLELLVKRGANLYDPETIKDVVAKQPWCPGRKSNACDAYSAFLKMVGGKWESPHYQSIRKIPFIPKETEIDQLIAACSSRMATFLQMLKETGARCGEIWSLKWADIDFESKVVTIAPEKNSNPRIAHLSNKLLEMLQKLPKAYGDRAFSFPHMPIDHHAGSFLRQRKRLALKLGNPRIAKIHFHTFRYWKGTMLYHKTKDMYYVMQALGHKSIKNTLLYVQLEEALFQGETDYISKVAKTEKEICQLIEVGFEYVTEFEGKKIFRKRKL